MVTKAGVNSNNGSITINKNSGNITVSDTTPAGIYQFVVTAVVVDANSVYTGSKTVEVTITVATGDIAMSDLTLTYKESISTVDVASTIAPTASNIPRFRECKLYTGQEIWLYDKQA